MKVFYSVELEGANFEDDTFCGTYQECIAYLIQNNYRPGNDTRIVKFEIDKGGAEQILCAAKCDDIDLSDTEAVEIITDWSVEWSENIKKLRRTYGLTQRELSEATNIPLRTIENWEAKKSEPAPYMLELVASKLREIYD